MSDDPYRYVGPPPTAPPQGGWTGGAYGWQPVPPPRYRPPARTGRSLLVGLGVVLVALALLVGGVGLTSGGYGTVDGRGAIALPADPGGPVQPAPTVPAQPDPGGSGSTVPDASGRTGPANATQQIGIVTIVSTLGYQRAQSAGTGMIVSPRGDVLTNNHVIRGATGIQVTVESTGDRYRARVVGTAPGSDVAVIRLTGARGLDTARLADDAGDVRVGDRVVGVGNAGGTGRLTAAPGRVTGLDRSITASDGSGQESERLNGLIEVNARIISGDSGGPLYDARGEVVGINTAASARSSTPRAYAIPIEDALAIRDRIASGVETDAIHIGYPGFLGVSTRDAPNNGGASVAALLDGGPANDAGIRVGSVITEVDGRPVRSADGLRAVLTRKDPGTRASVTWTDPGGRSRTATVTLGVGPAD
ncbi:S1C family serine protease [Jatrophihabitans fulvus]